MMKRSYIVALVLAVAAVAWILSGQLGSEREAEAQKPPAQVSAVEQTPKVRTRRLSAAVRTTQVVLRGRTEAVRTVDVKAETYGRVIELGIERGARVGGDQVIVRLSPESRPAALQEARALLEQRRIEYDAAKKLSAKGFRAETQLAAAEAALEAAAAQVRQAEIELGNTTISAPFEGIADDRMVELGDFVEVGDGIARIVDLDPILIVAHVNELDIGRLHVGNVGEARLITGLEVAGVIRFISTMADPQTRTFRVELEVPNPDGGIPDGVSAELTLPVDQIMAHQVSPSILTLTDDGIVGVKTLGPDNKVHFQPVQIIGNSADGVWLAGLPEEVTFITVGQEFVVHGQAVEPIDEGSLEPVRGAGDSS